MPRLYFSYSNDFNKENMIECIKYYLNNDETQLACCQKYNINYHAFKRYYEKYKNFHKDEIKKIQTKQIQTKQIQPKNNNLQVNPIIINNHDEQSRHCVKSNNTNKKSKISNPKDFFNISELLS